MVGVNITELAECYNLFSDRVYLSNPVAFTIAIFASVCMLCGTPSNLKIVLLYFVKSDFLGTFASAYTLLLALSDISMMLIVMPCIFILFGRNVLKQSCVLELTTQFLSTFFTRLSVLSIVLLGFDRIYHAKHPMDYGLKMTKKKLCISIGTAVSISLSFSAALTFTSIYFGKYYPHVAITLTCFDALLLTILLVSYLRFYVLYKNQDVIRRDRAKYEVIRMIVFFVIITTFLCYSPYIAFKFAWFLTDIAKIEKLWFFNYALYYSYCLFFSCSAVNAWIVVCRKKYL